MTFIFDAYKGYTELELKRRCFELVRDNIRKVARAISAAHTTSTGIARRCGRMTKWMLANQMHSVATAMASHALQ